MNPRAAECIQYPMAELPSAKQVAADKIQREIFEALFSVKPTVKASAQDWLCISRRPTLNEIWKPRSGSFIATCFLLGIDWRELSDTLKSAAEIDDSEHPSTTPNLRLVPRSEPSYT